MLQSAGVYSTCIRDTAGFGAGHHVTVGFAKSIFLGPQKNSEELYTSPENRTGEKTKEQCDEKLHGFSRVMIRPVSRVRSLSKFAGPIGSVKI